MSGRLERPKRRVNEERDENESRAEGANFGPPINYLSSPQFGQSTQMLGASLGSGGQTGGLTPLYRIGGPRSAQLALKLLF